MNTHVDKSLCVGCELCVQICPVVFCMDPDGKARAEIVLEHEEDACKDALASCPVSAISISEEET
jgi:ferredoxin